MDHNKKKTNCIETNIVWRNLLRLFDQTSFEEMSYSRERELWAKLEYFFPGNIMKYHWEIWILKLNSKQNIQGFLVRFLMRCSCYASLRIPVWWIHGYADNDYSRILIKLLMEFWMDFCRFTVNFFSDYLLRFIKNSWRESDILTSIMNIYILKKKLQML